MARPTSPSLALRDVLPRALADTAVRELGAERCPPEGVVDWLLSPATLERREVLRLLSFLRGHQLLFDSTRRLFPPRAEGRGGRKDEIAVATSPWEMLVLAHHLYLLRSHDVGGSVLECGCFKGYSSACLSLACEALGYPLIVADSFAGLPEVPGEVGDEIHYQAGDFAGSRQEVERHLELFGRPEVAELLPGRFRDTLAGWSRPLALLWMDVDLPTSAAEVLASCLAALHSRGVLASHDFEPADLGPDGRIARPDWLAATVHRHLTADDPGYRAEFAGGHTVLIYRREAVGHGSPFLLAALLPRLLSLDRLREGAESSRRQTRVRDRILRRLRGRRAPGTPDRD